MSKDIELGDKSIKFSYRSFLSDAAPGLALILIGFFSYSHPILGTPWKTFYNFTNLPSEVIIFISILLFFLSIPLGLFLNATSWIFLGWLEVGLEKSFIDGNLSFLAKSTKESLLYDDCMKFYFGENYKCEEIDSKKWVRYSKWMDTSLQYYYPDDDETLGRYEGIINFTRSMCLILIVILFSNLIIYIFRRIEYQDELSFPLLTLMALIIMIIVNAGVAFLDDSYDLLKGYLMYIKIKTPCDDNNCPVDIEKMVDVLAKASKSKKIR